MSRRKTPGVNPALYQWTTPSLWAMQFRNLKGQTMRFYSKTNPLQHRPWMVTPLDDLYHTVVVRKARQMGFTELYLTQVFYLATLCRLRAIYTMPTNPKAWEIARTRVDPLGSQNHPDSFTGEVLQRLTSGWKSLMQKSVLPITGGGTSEFMMTGSWTDIAGESTAADIVSLDEFDQMKPGIVSAFRECLSASRLRMLRLFSTPTIPKVGIDGQYQRSDKRRWFYKCTHCNSWETLTRANLVQVKGPDSLIPRLEVNDETASFSDGTFEIVCLHCKQPLDRMRAQGQWVAEDQDGEIHGYAASQLDCAWISGDLVMRKLRDYRPVSKWYNYVWGLPYLGDVDQIPEHFVYQLIDPDLTIMDGQDFRTRYPGASVSVGVDWGKDNWAMALGLPEGKVPILLEAFHFVDTHNVDDTPEAMLKFARKWTADVIVADYGYGQDRNPKMYTEAPCQFWVCQYPPSGSHRATSEALFGPNNRTAGYAYPMVNIGRAPSLEECIHKVYNRYLKVANIPQLERFASLLDLHFRNLAVTVEALADGSEVKVAHTTGPDHFLHTFNYAMVGREWLITRKVKSRELDYPNSVNDPANDPLAAQAIPTPEELVDFYDVIGL